MSFPFKSILYAPATQALIIQCAALFTALLLLALIGIWGQLELPLIVAALLQGAIAAALTYWRGLARWWLPIQLIFPVAVLTMQSLQLPPVIFLIVFVFLLSLYWSTFRTQVPFYPSGSVTWRAVARLLPQDRSLKFIDIGSGLGGLILHLARQRPDSLFVGIELAPLPWLVGWLRGRLQRSHGRFIRGDYEGLNFSQYDVVFAYLSPAAMPGLWIKAQAEMRAGTLLLSHEFSIPNRKPDIIIGTDGDHAALYGWRM